MRGARGIGRRLGVLLTVCALSAALLLIADDASARSKSRWTKPRAVLPKHKAIAGLQVKAGPGRFGVLAWRSGQDEGGPEASSGDEPRVFVSVRRPGTRRFGPPRAVSPPGSSAPRLGVAGDGQTVLTWRDASGIHAIFRTPNEGWSPPQTITGPDDRRAGAGLLAVGFDGTAIAMWPATVNGNDVLRAAARPPQGVFGEAQTVAGAPEGAGFLAVGVGGQGHGAVAWSGYCPLFEPELRENARVSFLAPLPPDVPVSMWSPPEEVPNSKCPDAGLRLALDDEGTAVLVINGSLRSWSGVRAAVRPPEGSFSRAELISRRGQQADFAELGMTGSGRAITTWNIYDRSRPRGLQAADRPPGGTFSSPLRIAGRRGGGLRDLAVNQRGSAVVVWQSMRSFRLKANYMRPDRSFGRPKRVSPPLTKRALAEPAVAINPGGRALVAWSKPDAFHGGGHGVFVAERAPN